MVLVLEREFLVVFLPEKRERPTFRRALRDFCVSKSLITFFRNTLQRSPRDGRGDVMVVGLIFSSIFYELSILGFLGSSYFSVV